MKNTSVRKLIYTIRHKYMTFNNLVILVAFCIAAGWVWGSLQVMQRNYALQKEVDHKRRQLQLAELQKDSLALQNRYYATDEYKELALRDSLGLVMPGEKVLILPDAPPQSDEPAAGAPSGASVEGEQVSNLEQWMNFLFGGYSRSMNSDES